MVGFLLTPKSDWMWTNSARQRMVGRTSILRFRRVAPVTGEPKNAGRFGTINDDHEEESSMRPRTHMIGRSIDRGIALRSLPFGPLRC